MYFTDDSLLPENQAPPMVAAARPMGPIWLPGIARLNRNSPSGNEQVQAAGSSCMNTDGRYYPGRRVDAGTSTLGLGERTGGSD